tara:strand:+ start:1241 stop:2188 length:948 start_codon:yes stop_codon:yes gene_type:complete
MELLRFKPLYKERVWGGQNLATRLGRSLPQGKAIGESWDIVDRDLEQSIILEGPFEGKSLGQLLETYPQALMGPKFPIGNPFPILVKWLDCRETLSVQVHPPQNIASILGAEPKTEYWYILDSTPDAKLYLGLNPGENLESFKSALTEDRLEDLLAEVPTQAGDSFYIESGSLHAIGAGHLILEIQQNSDSTYRAYDWQRVGLDGKPRKLHIEESIKSIVINDLKPIPIRMQQSGETLVDRVPFRIRGYTLQPESSPLCLPKETSPHLIHVLEGKITEQNSGQCLRFGESALLPYASSGIFVAQCPSKLLITDQF